MNLPHVDPIGKTVVIGLCYFDEAGRIVLQKQCHGRIRAVSKAGVDVELSGGEMLLLPCAVAELQVAPPGEFTESSTGEVVSDPAFITMWNVRRQSADENRWDWERGPDIQFPDS
jgi:hypothetical protein